MTVINTNVSATLASNAITRNDRAMSTAMERLSTGLRINSAADDAAGLAIASRMRSQVDGLEQAARNANDGISMIQTAEGAYIEVSNMLSRMKELAVQASSGTYSNTDRAALNLEFGQLQSEMKRIAGNTQWNGFNILDGAAGGASATVNYQVGAGSGQTMAATFNTLYKNVATSTATAESVVSNRTQSIVDISGSSIAAGDHIKITLTDNGGNKVDLLLNVDATAATALSGGAGKDTVVDGDIHYADNGYTALNTVLGQAGHAGITVELGYNGTANAANKIFIKGTADTQPFTLAATDVSIVRGEVSTLDAFDVSSATNAQKSVTELDSLITTVAAGRAKYGAYINRLEYAADNLMNVAQNTDASRSRIEDADYASETSELARTQIISQASTAMLAQANQSKQSVLALLQ
ncbi:MAG: flagellin [Gammaproteobacteria bacterium]|nr:flagellin [Gammaproteobacteria bacterium]